MNQTIKAMQLLGRSLTQVFAVNPIATGDTLTINFVRRVAYGPNPPRPNFSTAAENQRWVEQLRKRVEHG